MSRDVPAATEELFGLVATVIEVADEAEALRDAKDTQFGLGASLWTKDTVREFTNEKTVRVE